MPQFAIQLPQLFTIALANFILSWLWYSPVLFVKPWMKALGIPENHVMTAEQKKELPYLLANGLLCSFLLSFALQVFCRKVGAADFMHGAMVGVLAWLGFALTGSLSTLWEGRSKKVLVINNGLFIFSYIVFGGIIAVWR